MINTDVVLTEILERDLPFGRRVRLVEARYESGLTMLRLIWREGTRITQIEIAAEDAEKLGHELTGWAQKNVAQGA